jgi:segregation and condensation protein B
MIENETKDLKEKKDLNFDMFDKLLKGENSLKTCIEGILFIAESSVSSKEIAKVLNISEKSAIEIIDQLEKEYIETERGFILRKIGGGYRLYSNPSISEILKEFVNSNIKFYITQAALETLAIIAYKQPVTRSQIAEIRGVKNDSIVSSLKSKGLVEEAGRLREPGNPILYKTTYKFLEVIGIRSINDLPPLETYE